MSQTFNLYNDAGLTSLFNPAGGDKLTAESDGGSHDRLLYLGSNDAAKQLQAVSNPGIDDIVVTPTDATPGADHEATEIRLSSSFDGLDLATPGAALVLGPTLVGGVGNATPIYIRLTDGTTGVATEELSLVINDCYETTI